MIERTLLVLRTYVFLLEDAFSGRAWSGDLHLEMCRLIEIAYLEQNHEKISSRLR